MGISLVQVEEIKNSGVDFVELNHAYRLNGCVDIYKKGRTVFNKLQGEYKNFSEIEESIQYAINLAHALGKHDAFKKTKALSRMTYQEFKNKKLNSHKYPASAVYHWKQNSLVDGDFLYFIKSGIYVKIGRSINPRKRLKELSVGMAEKPKLVLKVKGRGHMENTIHKCFKGYRKNGEWFFFSNEICEFIKFIKI